MICVSIGRTRHKMVVAEHRALADQGAELVELRLDWLSRVPDLNRLLAEKPTPVVLTCRRRSDKGRWSGSEDQRQTVLRSAIVCQADYVDLEDDIAKAIPRYGETRRIISHHNFDETPDDLEEIHKRMCDLDPDIVKLVTMANRPEDSVRLLKLVAGSEVPTVGFCMGELGLASRLLCGKYGAPFTYATFSSERALAPGQLSYEEMAKVFRYDRIGSQTRVFGVLGDPVGHSHSPLIHNAAFDADGLDAVYLPLRVPADRLQQTLDAFEWLEIDGYSVTIPHKEAVLEFATNRDASVERLGAANTLCRTAGSDWSASNTDLPAAIDALQTTLGSDRASGSLKGRKCLVLGAGGAARAIAGGLIDEEAAVTVSGRTRSRANELATELGCQEIGWENRGTQFTDVLINCTPVGMHPEINETPFQPQWLDEGTLVFDTVYNPENTLLLKQARQRGCPTVSGVEMFVRQAARQYDQFTNRPAPLGVMREALRHGISAVR
ncbi:MAG: shikimate dehydrogenase [Planctomycetaceae bacterium]|jgi:3-dehydroquinate dehydratase/shikimate dehydrogenase|nr:shikimate dehydrogenase [Planctomycetaceae bacterium]MDP7277659.1 shikimate dehydrogenase [Planctomycetaceae bacterium]